MAPRISGNSGPAFQVGMSRVTAEAIGGSAHRGLTVQEKAVTGRAEPLPVRSPAVSEVPVSGEQCRRMLLDPEDRRDSVLLPLEDLGGVGPAAQPSAPIRPGAEAGKKRGAPPPDRVR